MVRFKSFFLMDPFEHFGGRQFCAMLPDDAGYGDDERNPFGSGLVLLEDGRPTGPAHSEHALIASDGGGRFSHWKGQLRFSSSDGSSPQSNGKAYSVAWGDPPPKILVLGSCNLMAAAENLHARGLAQSLWRQHSAVHSPAEAEQLLAYHLDGWAIPPRLEDLVLAQGTAKEPLCEIGHRPDLLIVEASTPVVLKFEGCLLMRGELYDRLVAPLANQGTQISEAAHRWYNFGLLRGREADRLDAIDRLRPFLDKTFGPDRGLAELILTDTTSRTCTADEVATSLDLLRVRTGALAIAVATSVNIYTKDARPMTWPGNYPREIETLCAKIGVPCLHSSAVIKETGPAGLSDDCIHFTGLAAGVMGERLLRLCQMSSAVLSD